MTRKLSIVLLAVLLFQTLSSSFMLPSQAISSSDMSIFKNISVIDEEGNQVDAETMSGSDVEVSIDWSVADLEVEADSKETITFDSDIVVQQEQTSNLLFEEQQVGEYTAGTDNTVTIRLNEVIEEYPEASGNFVISAVTSDEQQEANSEEEAVESKEEEQEATTDDKATEEKDSSHSEGTEESTKEEQQEPANEDENVSSEEESTTKSTSASSDIEPSAELGNIFTFDYLKMNEEDINDGDIIDIGEGTIAHLGFKWDTQGHNAKDGDTAEILLSDAFEMVDSPKQPIIVDGIDVGTYYIENGVLKFEFNENIENDNVHNGFVDLGLEFNLAKFSEDIEQEIKFNDSEDNSLTIIAKPNGDISGIDKEGHPDTDHDAREIIWEVDVINTNEEEITDATLADNIPDGLGEARDFVIHELVIGYDGDKTVGNEVTLETSSDTEGEFEVELGTIAPYKGYRIQYTTTIEDYSKESFTNDATFNYGDTNLPAKATVGGLTRSDSIEKSGSQKNNEDKIQWEIDVNKNGSLINNAIVNDDLPDGLTLDPKTIKVMRITQNGDNWSEGDPHEGEFTEFPIQLGELGQDDAYRIKFETDVDWEKVNSGEYLEENGFKNTATLYNDNIEVDSDDATVDIVRDPVLRKEGTSNVDYDDKTVTWTIHVNEAGHPVGEAVLTDLIPEGLEISENDIEITDEDGKTYSPNNININPDADGGTGVEIDLGNIGTQQLTVTYTTKITDFERNYFNNGVGIKGDGIGEDGAESNATITPVGNSYTKSFTGIDYAEKTIDWKLNVDPKREAIDALVIEDTFPNKGLILLPDEVKVTHKGEPLTEGDDYTLEPRTEGDETGYHKGFTIELLPDALPLDGGQLEVTYQTSYDPQKEVDGNTLDTHQSDGEQDRVYTNHAQFTGTTENGNEIDEGRDADTTVREDSWNSGKKEGQLVHVDDEGNLVNGWESGSERKIAWQLYTNYQEQDLGSNVTITDTLQYDGEIDEESIQVSVYNVNANGTTEITDEVLDSEKYTLKVDGENFELTFEEDVTKRYIVEFTTSVPNISEPNYTNNAMVEVDGEEYPYSSTLNYNKHNDFLVKDPVSVDGGSVFTGDEIDWEVRVNESLSNIKEPIITDTISAGLVYVKDSLEIVRLDGTEESSLEEGTDYTLDVTTTDDNENVLTIELTDELKDTIILRYSTVVTEEDGEVNNTISLEGSEIEEKSVESQELQARVFSNVGGEWATDRGALRVTKIDAETEDIIANNEATFKLEFDLNGERQQFGEYTTENGVLEVGNLPLRTYYLTEVEAPNGYVLSDEEIEIVVDTGFDNDEDNIETVEFENTKEKVDITGTKVWEGGESVRPDSIELQLFRNGEKLRDAVTLEAGETEYTWTALDKTDIDGNAYDYTVDEVQVPEHFEKSVSEDGLTITNEFVSPNTEISVEKVWEDADNQDGIRPDSIEVALLANGEETDEENNITLNNDNEWKNSFTNLPELDNRGEKITYTVEEVDVPEQYESEIAGNTEDGFVITNSYAPSTIAIPVEKLWDDEDNQDGKRPNAITVNLFADGEETGQSIVLNPLKGWEASFTNLDKYQNGEKITYTVEESNVPEEYDSAISGTSEDGFTITNSYTPEVIDIAVEKNWEDANDQDGARPDSITINLYDDRSQVVETKEITADENGDWSHVFKNLPKYHNGEEIEYSVAENTVEDYSTEISYNPDGTFTVTNEHTPEQTSVTVNKFWDDAGDQDGQRPGSIRVQLLADGEPLGDEVFLTAADNWSYTWSELDANRDGGTTIEYSVEEVDVPAGYESEINDENHGAITITNSYEPELIDIPVKKEWDDANDQDGKRPESITLHVVNQASEVVKTEEVMANENGEWSHVFEGLPKYHDGNKIEYRVVEDAIEDYSTDMTKHADGSFVVTNSYTPEQTSMTVVKGWEDGNNQDGVRPDNVTVQLFADGEPVNSPVQLSEENDWTYSWTELDVYHDGGQIIDYTVEETDVPASYEEPAVQEENGVVLITNIRTPDTVEIPVTKVWEDEEDQDGVRPDGVTVNVMNDLSEIVATVELNEENDWAHTFEGLPKNQNGEEIRYRITENTVEDYSTEVEVNEENRVTITNAYTPEQTSVTVSKGWNDNNNQDGIRPEQVEVQLYAGEDEIGDTVILSEDNDWMHTWSELDAYQNGGEEIDYTVKEVSVPDGYENSVNDMDHGNIILTNLHEPEQTSVSVSKIWEDANNQDGVRPEFITVNLLADEEKVDSLHLNESNNWQANFTELDKFKNGELIDYTVEEVAVDPYETETTGNAENGYVITNTYEPELIDLAGTKTWDDADNQDGKRPDSITVCLLANGEEVKDIEVTAEMDWEFAFTDLPKFANGEEINYTIQENGVENYSTEIDGMDITNSYTPEQTSINVVKSWEDANNQDGKRPDSITVNLQADGENTGQELVLNEANNWQGDFTELDVYADGETIEYSIEEEGVESYETAITGTNDNGYVITNSYTPEVIDLVGSKTWDDAENQDGKRPNAITVRLLANGEDVKDIEVTEETEWEFAFTDLPKFANGEEINYTVQEDEVEDYSTAIDGLNITNSYTPEQTSINVVKRWNDANNKEARPESITVHLLANGEEVDSVELSESNNWQADFGGLDIYADGDEIDYSVVEEEVYGYKGTIDVKDKNNVVIVNSPKKVSVGDYVWFDKNKNGLQDDTDIPIEGVVLTIEDEDGNPVTDVYGSPVGPTTTDKNGWYTFDNLPIDNTYIVRIDREASAKALEGYEPTLHEVGDDRAKDSSSWFAISRHLTEDEERDPTLDFGFVREVSEDSEDNDSEEPTKPEDSGDNDSEESTKPEDSGDNDSEESTKPEDSGDADSEESTKPENSGDTDSQESIKSEDSGDSNKTSKDILPDTATDTFNLFAVGLVLLFLGVVSMVVVKRRKQ
ncbi:Cna B-type domain-containing protein [Gracilibacillus sp. S3-1-1]|uniref:Cna B-type domain-containing protein n=1 Tax=Gracilibacillus pellucidus TaxID=3095368 RepID=A0ACC6M3G9_9BACI|nr:Cna B-type domain-containing protein [Gracilibacillus sp. S3-1-1]MDX8045505.1 Cna B-type domain-containing protein [Gracilibacillus sp. S3-1-1]